MLFVPPSIPSMIPEASAVAVQDRGDFHLVYLPTSEYADLESQVQSWNYFEKQVGWLNQKFKLPHDIVIAITECGTSNAFYASKEYLGEDYSVIAIC